MLCACTNRWFYGCDRISLTGQIKVMLHYLCPIYCYSTALCDTKPREDGYKEVAATYCMLVMYTEPLLYTCLCIGCDKVSAFAAKVK